MIVQAGVANLRVFIHGAGGKWGIAARGATDFPKRLRRDARGQKSQPESAKSFSCGPIKVHKGSRGDPQIMQIVRILDFREVKAGEGHFGMVGAYCDIALELG